MLKLKLSWSKLEPAGAFGIFLLCDNIVIAFIVLGDLEVQNSVTEELLHISGFVLDEKLQQNAAKFAIFYIYEKQKLLFPFFISGYFIFFLNICPGLFRHRPGHSLGKKMM